MINQQNMKVKNGSTWHTICPFPVGFIYLAATSTSPGTTFGGTWVALTSGHFLRPAGTFSGTGGESSHTLTVGEMPSHQHTLSNLLLRDSGTYSGGRHRTDWGSNATKAETTASAGGGSSQQSAALSKRIWMETNRIVDFVAVLRLLHLVSHSLDKGLEV